MFDGISDQIHQFIASSRPAASLPISLSFPNFHGSSSPSFTTSFDPFPPSHHHHQSVESHHHHLLHSYHPHYQHQLYYNQIPQNSKEKDQQQTTRSGCSLVSRNLELELDNHDDDDRVTSIQEPTIDSWTNEEVLALLRVRSSLENWLPDFTWEHVSRKLRELGFQKSADKCKEKFEEESRLLNNINHSKNSSYGCFSELEEIYHGDISRTTRDKNNNQKPKEGEGQEEQMVEKVDHHQERKRGSKEDELEKESQKMVMRKKRKRKQKMETFKRFCVGIVNKMMAQQEELHNRLLEDMTKRDDYKAAREEAWKKEEMDRAKRDIETRAREQEISNERQTTIIGFLKRFTLSFDQPFIVPNSPTTTAATTSSMASPSLIISTGHNKAELNTSPNKKFTSLPQALPLPPPLADPQSPNSDIFVNNTEVPTPSTPCLPPQNPNSSINDRYPPPQTPSSSVKDGESSRWAAKEEGGCTGRRWPKNEVMALINLRCSTLINKNEEEQEGVTAGKVPRWERISQGMSELGYKRTAKRCKEKWENINKYFRKTMDANKKRPLDSRTCPYFHQLSSLYSQTASGPLSRPENCPASPSKPPI